VARWFFSVGSAATGVAKAISAYDMAVSDALYGPTRRYVSRQRLEAMLQYELDQLIQQLGPAEVTRPPYLSDRRPVAATQPPAQRSEPKKNPSVNRRFPNAAW